MEGLSYGTQTAGMPCFGQFNGDSVFQKAMEMVGSCFCLGLMIRKCLMTLLKLWCTGMRVVLCYARLLQL